MIWDLISQPEKSFQDGPLGPPAFRGWKGETEPKEEVKGAWSVGWEHMSSGESGDGVGGSMSSTAGSEN